MQPGVAEFDDAMAVQVDQVVVARRAEQFPARAPVCLPGCLSGCMAVMAETVAAHRADALQLLQPAIDGGEAEPAAGGRGALQQLQIGRALCRERVCQYVSISGVAGTFKKKITTTKH